MAKKPAVEQCGKSFGSGLAAICWDEPALESPKRPMKSAAGMNPRLVQRVMRSLLILRYSGLRPHIICPSRTNGQRTPPPGCLPVLGMLRRKALAGAFARPWSLYVPRGAGLLARDDAFWRHQPGGSPAWAGPFACQRTAQR